jgi:Uma2 family endonuclease
MPSFGTRAAEGFSRRVFTVDEVLLMQKSGVIAADENFELIDGEIVPMGPKYAPHEHVKSLVGMALAKACPAHLLIGFETSVKLSDKTIVEPDLCVYRRGVASALVEASDVLLAIEVSVTSLSLDRGLKASLYAKALLPVLWIFDVPAERIIVHASPRGEGHWEAISEHAWSDELVHPALPALSLRLGDL